MARREWDRSESGAVQNGTGKGRRGKWRWPPDWAVRREPFGRVKGIHRWKGGRVHEVGEGRQNRLTQQDVGGTGVGQNRGGGNSA